MPRMPDPEPPTPAHSNPANATPKASTGARFLAGLRSGLPILLGYFPVGAAFGILARGIGFSVTVAVVCSATALAGAGQFIALSLLGAGASADATLAATAVVNLRYVLFSTTLSPHLGGVGALKQAWLGFTLTDETFAVNIAERRSGTSSVASMAGVGAIAWVGWVSGTALGAAGAGLVSDPSRWGVDFAMPAMFAALFVALAENRRHVMTGAFAALLAVVVPLIPTFGVSVDPSWFVVIAAVLGASAGAVVFRGR